MPAPPRGVTRASLLLTPLAALGVTLGLGRRAGETWRGPRLTGRLLLERIGVSDPVVAAATALGLGQQLLLAAAWGLVLGSVLRVVLRAGARSLGARLGAALAGGVSLAAINLVLPPVLRLAFPLAGSAATAIPLAIGVAVALLGAGWTADAPEVVARA